MHERERFDEIDVEVERAGHRARNLRHLDGVSEAVAEVVGITAGENLGLGFETAKGACVDDAVAVALEIVTVGVGRLGEAAAAGVFYLYRVAGQHEESLAELMVGISSMIRPSGAKARVVFGLGRHD